MASQYSRDALKVVVAQICQAIGWHGINTTPLELLVDILHRHLLEISKLTAAYAAQFNRCEPNLNDVALAFQDMQILLPDLEEYVQYVDAVPCAINVPKFPVSTESHLNLLKPGSSEVLTRPVHVHEHLPPMYPENESRGQTPMYTEHELSYDQIDGDTKCSSPINVTSSPPMDNIFKRPGEPISHFESPKRARLMWEEERGARPTREISSVMMTTSGFISPAREGKLPESRTPIAPMDATNHSILSNVSVATDSNKTEKKVKKIRTNEKKMDKDKKRGKELFKPDKISIQDPDAKSKKVVSMKEVLKHKALKTNSVQCPVIGTSPLLSLDIHKTGTQKPIIINSNKGSPAGIKSVIPPLAPLLNKSMQPSLPNNMMNEMIHGKLSSASPDKLKLNVFKKFSKAKEDKLDKPIKIDENIVNSSNLISDRIVSKTARIRNEVLEHLTKPPPEVNLTLKQEIIEVPQSLAALPEKSSIGLNQREERQFAIFDEDLSLPNHPLTPKTPELPAQPSPPRKVEKVRKKREKKDKKLEKKNKVGKIKSPKPSLGRPKTPEAVINHSRDPVSIPMPMPVLPHMHSGLPFGFMNYPPFSSGPGLIPQPGLIPGPGIFPGPPLMPSMQLYNHLQMNAITMSGKHGFGKPPHMPPHPNLRPLFLLKPEIDISAEKPLEKPIIPTCNVAPLVLPSSLNITTEEPIVKPSVLSLTDSTPLSQNHEKSEKKKDKEHKKDKKDKESKIKKKKDKKDKVKNKEKDKKRDKDEKRDKEKKEKKEKKDKRKEKEREHEGSVPKLTLKLGSPRPPTPDQPVTSRKIKIKPIVKKDEAAIPAFRPLIITHPELAAKGRELSPELAKISALITRPPKPRPVIPKGTHEDNAKEGGVPAVPPKASPGPGRPRGSSNVVKSGHSPKTSQAPNPSLPNSTSTKPTAMEEDGSQVWICPACGAQDDGSPMIGCDDCDAWYHWVCVGIQVPPDDNEDWYCRFCIKKKQFTVAVANDRKKKRKKNKKNAIT